MPRKRRQPEEARRLILDAARQLIAEEGPDRLTLKKIAKRAGVSEALVGHYFEGRSDVIESALLAYAAEVRERFFAAVSEADLAHPERLAEMFVESLADPMNARFGGWLLLSGRLDGPNAISELFVGPRRVADIMEARYATEGRPVPREQIDYVLMLFVAASWGFALGGRTLMGALGRTDTEAERKRYVQWLSRLIRYLGEQGPSVESVLAMGSTDE